MKRFVALMLFLPVAAVAAGSMRSDGVYDPQVPEPASVLGFEPGARPARHAEALRYAEALAAASPRVAFERSGKTVEGRDLMLLTVSSKENLARLEAIRAAVTALSDPRQAVAADELAGLIETTPAVAFMVYSVHGDEFSGADAALSLAYELAAGETPDVRKIRKELVVLIDPMQNPDGRERMLSINATFKGNVANPDPDAMSHEGVWPWGRTNHYFFDLNRDWFALINPESRARARILRAWRPQLVVDAHEMGSRSTFLFNPPRAPFNPQLPSHTLSWWDRFAADQARAFDRHGWSYFTGEWNEEFYPGYGSALTLYQGAVGILHEEAGTGGEPIRKPYGAVLTYRDSVERQFVGSLANLETAADNKNELLRSYREARAEAVERGRRGPVRAYYFAPYPDPARAARLAESLALLGIEVERLTAEGKLAAAHTIWADGEQAVTLPAGSYRVRLDQPDGLLASVVLQPHTPMGDPFLAEEREHLERQKGSRVYDVTAWSSLVASGLEAYWTPRLDGLAWEPVARPQPPQGQVAAGEAGYGWLFDGTTDGALALAGKLAAEGFKVRVGEKPFRLGEHAFPRGSFLARVEENPAGLAEALARLAPGLGVKVVSTPTARISEGPDLGGDHWTLLVEPRIGILAGPPTNYGSVGAAWHLLDDELGMRVSLLDVSRLGRIDLDRYNVLVMPSAWPGGEAYRRAITDKALGAIRTWIEEGGTLVALAGGAEFAALDGTGLSKARPRREVLKEFPAPAFGLDKASIETLELMQGTGLGPDGKAVVHAGVVSAEHWPAALGIPGAGSPVLGPGTWAMLGKTGEAARKRGSLLAAAAPAGGKAGEGKAANGKGGEMSEEALNKADERLRRFMPDGALLRVDLDPEHWLAYGLGDKVAVMAMGRTSLIARDPVRVVGRLAAPDRLHLGGLLWPEAAGRLSQTAWLSREGMGRGQIILFATDPNFRGYFWGTERLFVNAVLLGPGAGTEQTVPW